MPLFSKQFSLYRTTFKHLTFVIIGFGLCCISHPAYAAAVSWTGGSGAWETGGNWSGGSAPGADDDVTIDASVTVTINGTTTINSLTLGNGSGTTSPTLSFDYDAISGTALIIDEGDLTVNTSSTVTHTDAIQGAKDGTINIDVQGGNVTVNGSITGDAKGYEGGKGNPESGYGSGGGTGTGSWETGGGGGGYAGTGGLGTGAGTVGGGGSYGSFTNPTNLGSGGGTGDGSMDGGDGGGALKLSVGGELAVGGTISFNGGNGSYGGNCGHGYAPGGGGSGGSINISTQTLSGAGTIRANGGNGRAYCGTSGNGGGGRILVSYSSQNTFTGSVSVTDGVNGNAGQDGTALIIDSTNNDLYLQATQRWHANPSLEGVTHTYRNVTVSNNSTLYISSFIDIGSHTGGNDSSSLIDSGSSWAVDSWDGVTVANHSDGGKGTVTSNTSTEASVTLSGGTGNDWDTGDVYHLGKGIIFNAVNFTLESGSTINGNSAGYYPGTAEQQWGYGPGRGGPGGWEKGGGGGGHGGAGGVGGGVAGATYGVQLNPLDLGSGGASGDGGPDGGYGGAAIKITGSTSVDISGSIYMNGGIGQAFGNCGHGSGPGGGGFWRVR
jgi:hypothetical protein